MVQLGYLDEHAPVTQVDGTCSKALNQQADVIGMGQVSGLWIILVATIGAALLYAIGRYAWISRVHGHTTVHVFTDNAPGVQPAGDVEGDGNQQMHAGHGAEPGKAGHGVGGSTRSSTDLEGARAAGWDVVLDSIHIRTESALR